MTLLRRIGYYLGGFSVGLVVLAFFLSGKRVSCDYGPSARVKKNINTKEIQYSSQVQDFLLNNNINSSSVKELISKGSVIFSESNTKLDSCKIYIIKSELKNSPYRLTIKNCDKIATVQNMK